MYLIAYCAVELSITEQSMEVETRSLHGVIRELSNELASAPIGSAAVDKSVSFRCDDQKIDPTPGPPHVNSYGQSPASLDIRQRGGGNENISSSIRSTRHYSFSHDEISQANVQRRRNSDRY